MQYTENYEMKKPEPTDFYNIEDFNDNTELIDLKIKELETARENIDREIVELKKYVSDGKSAVASAVTEMGVSTSTDATFGKIVEGIKKIVPTLRQVAGKVYANINGLNEQEIEITKGELNTPSFSWSGNQVTATTSIMKNGYVDSSNNVQNVTGITSKSATTITPNTTTQTAISSGERVYFSGALQVGSLGGNAGAGQVLSGYTFSSNAAGREKSGSMANNGAVSASLYCSGSYTIPAGYHNGSGKVTANSLSSQTSATASSANILKDYTAWVNGSKITGDMNKLADYRYIPDQTLQIRERSSYTDGTGATQSCANTKFLSVYEGCAGFIPSTSNEHMILLSRLGNASASQVLEGVTFTSGNCSSVAQQGTLKIVNATFQWGWGNQVIVPQYIRNTGYTYNGYCTTAWTQTSGGGATASQGTGYIDINASSGSGGFVIQNGITLPAGTYRIAVRTVEYSGGGSYYIYFSDSGAAPNPGASKFMIVQGTCAADEKYHNYTKDMTLSSQVTYYPCVYVGGNIKYSICSIQIWKIA